MKSFAKRTFHSVFTLIFLMLLMLCMTVCAAASDSTTISGKLVSSSGDPIRLTGTNGSIAFRPTNNSASITPQEMTVNSDGTFSATLPATTGQYIMYYSTTEDNSINVIPKQTFYYRQNATTASKMASNGTKLDLSSGDFTDLKLVVDTGYSLTGKIVLDENAVLGGSPNNEHLAQFGFGLRSEDSAKPNLYYIVFFLDEGETSWSYRMIVPKNIGSSILMVYHLTPQYGVETNLHTGNMDITKLNPTGDMTLPTIVLSPAQAVITADITVDDYSATGVDVYVVTANDRYHFSYTDYYGGNFDIQATIPSQDTARTYQIYYEINYDASGSLVEGPVYVGADGVLTTDPAQAYDFPIQDRTHPIEPLKMPPFAEGRIYIPNYNGELFYIDVRARKGNTNYATNSISVSSGIVKTDEQGRSYVTYSLSSNQVTDGTAYILSYTIYYDKGDFHQPWNSGTFYADEDGGLLVVYPERYTFAVDEDQVNEMDVTLLTWDDGSEWMYIQGEHGITAVPTDSASSYSVTYPGASSLKVTFTYRTDVSLLVNGTQYTSNQLAGKTIEVTGDTLTIEYVDTTYSKLVLYGFAVEKVEPVYPDDTAVPGSVVSVYGGNGSDKDTILENLASGDVVRVTLSNFNDLSGGILVCAAYNADGRLIQAVLTDVTFSQGFGTASAQFGPCAGAADLRLMLLSSDTYIPLMDCWSL